jgi:hypothetical protein
MRASIPCVSTFILLASCAAAPPPPPAAPAGQTFPQAFALICDVDRLGNLSVTDDPLGAGAKRTAWLGEHVDNPDGIELRTVLSVKGAAEQAKMLHDQARMLGVPRCALADALEKTEMGGLSP